MQKTQALVKMLVAYCLMNCSSNFIQAGDENNSKPLLEVVLMHAETRTLQAIKNIALMLRRDQSNNGLGKEQEQNLNQASDGNIL